MSSEMWVLIIEMTHLFWINKRKYKFIHCKLVRFAQISGLKKKKEKLMKEYKHAKGEKEEQSVTSRYSLNVL